jgi:hypothetical protein
MTLKGDTRILTPPEARRLVRIPSGQLGIQVQDDTVDSLKKNRLPSSASVKLCVPGEMEIWFSGLDALFVM